MWAPLAKWAALLLGATLAAAPALAQHTGADRGRTLIKRPAMSLEKVRCTIQDNNSGNALPDGAHGDPLFRLVTAQAFCPQNALIFRDVVKQSGMRLHPAMVANRGYNNPLPQGSFSFFEAVDGNYQGVTITLGDWFFGHFQTANNNNTVSASELVEQQQGSQDNLLLESIVWDPTIGMFRFYEIRGNGQGGEWFYRGTSMDIQSDIQNLWRNTDPGQPIFGQLPATNPGRFGGANTPFKLRCSGCHMDGGPIMKELEAPHDSWWRRERPLQFGSMVVQQQVQNILNDVVDANEFARWIKAGSAKLLNSKPYLDARAQISLQEQLRPLFCTQEVNLESDLRPYQQNGSNPIQAPAAFFVDPRLLGGTPQVPVKRTIPISNKDYTAALDNFGSSFFDYQTSTTAGIDSDHAFEGPAKGHANSTVVDALVNRGLITQSFVIAVLAVDMTRPCSRRIAAACCASSPPAPRPTGSPPSPRRCRPRSRPAPRSFIAISPIRAATPRSCRRRRRT